MDILDCCSEPLFDHLQEKARECTHSVVNKLPFTFDGLETEIASVCGGQETFNSFVYSYVIYHPNHLAVYQTNNQDLISFGFQGCYMALFNYKGQKYGAHIAKDSGIYEGKNYLNNSVLLWNHLVSENIIECISMFDPTEAIPYCYKKHWGIIRSDGSCFAVLRDENDSPFLVQNKTPLKGKEAIIPIS